MGSTVTDTLQRLLGCLALIAVSGCASLPQPVERMPTQAYTDTAETRLGRAFGPLAAANAGKSGVHPLRNGLDAFAARVMLARAADRGLDIQYYIWQPDTSGALMIQALWDAAERGVRVRLLLDDANTRRLDPALATLDAHPNIEVRLFNPFPNRAWRIGDYATDFSRLNRRMHNKSFTADNQASIVGGRNIGDEYLGADSAVEFTDLDVIVAGAVVKDISADFDAYWNSRSAYPAADFVGSQTPEAAAALRAGWATLADSPQGARYLAAVRELPFVAQVLDQTLPFEWVPGRLVSDDPRKVLNPPARKDLQMLPQLEQALGRPASELLLVSPYFVPTREGTAALVAIAQRGVKVLVLTKSLAATDVTPVYAGYAKYRQDLLRGGVRLFELKGSPRPEKARSSGRSGGSGAGSSGASLHAKVFAVDKRRVYVGSFNFDPRSARLNTEMGVVLDSAALATQLADVFEREVPLIAYEVRMGADGERVEWIDRREAGEVRLVTAPEVGVLKRIWIGFLSVLPIEWLL